LTRLQRSSFATTAVGRHSKDITVFLQRYAYLTTILSFIGYQANGKFLDTDIVPVDCGVELEGYDGDAAQTFAFAKVTEDVLDLAENHLQVPLSGYRESGSWQIESETYLLAIRGLIASDSTNTVSSGIW
jgi:methionine aminopeptidase